MCVGAYSIGGAQHVGVANVRVANHQQPCSVLRPIPKLEFVAVVVEVGVEVVGVHTQCMQM